MRSCLLVHSQIAIFSLHFHREKTRGLSGAFLFIRALISFVRAPPSWPSDLPGGPTSQDDHLVGQDLNIWISWGPLCSGHSSDNGRTSSICKNNKKIPTHKPNASYGDTFWRKDNSPLRRIEEKLAKYVNICRSWIRRVNKMKILTRFKTQPASTKTERA